MPTGSSLKIMMEEMPERTYDVGIAEQHAVTFSAGLAIEDQVETYDVAGTVFIDADEDQTQGIYELGIANVTVLLMDGETIVDQHVTSDDGTFFFAAAAGSYTFAPLELQTAAGTVTLTTSSGGNLSASTGGGVTVGGSGRSSVMRHHRVLVLRFSGDTEPFGQAFAVFTHDLTG